jgi:hypothetical protein
MEEEYGCNKGERENENDERVTIKVGSAVRAYNKKETERRAHTRRPGESSVYNFSIVLDDPPAPAARDELGFDTCDATARRLQIKHVSKLVEGNATAHTGLERLAVWQLHPLLKMNAMRRSGKVRQSQTGGRSEK